MKSLKFAAAALACLGSIHVADASAQGYVTDTRGAIVKSGFGLCWRTSAWTPAMAVAECDPGLVPKPAPARPAPAPAPRPAAPAPAPKPAAPAAAKPKRCDATVALQSDQVFEFNKAALTAAAKARLEKDVIGRLLTCATVEAVIVEAHTDRLGSQQYNQKLSDRRAESVKRHLVSRGVDAAKIETLGMGKTVQSKSCPDAKNQSRKALIACLAPNRRAIISIKGAGK